MKATLYSAFRGMGLGWWILGITLPLILVGISGEPKASAEKPTLPTWSMASIPMRARVKNDQIRDVEYIQRFRILNRKYRFVRYSENYVSFRKKPEDIRFFKALAQSDTRKLRIAHIGDSHIQADIYTATVRDRLQEAFGNGGRGFIFPNRVAGSNNPDDYTTSYTGSWAQTRNTHPTPVLATGVSGFALSTTEVSATISFQFRNPNKLSLGTYIQVWCDTAANQFTPTLTINGNASQVLSPIARLTKGGYLFKTTEPVTSGLTLGLQGQPGQSQFVLQGFVLENEAESGILYSSFGVNGARITSYLNSPLFLHQLQNTAADLVILDLGVNDFYTKAYLPADLGDSLRALIADVQTALPEATIILASHHPCQYKKRTVYGSVAFAQLLKTIASEDERIGVYDFYNITNSRQSIAYMRGYKFMQSDGIHLTHSGYRHKGELFSCALLGGYQQYLVGASTTYPSKETLVLQQPVAEGSLDIKSDSLLLEEEETAADSSQEAIAKPMPALPAVEKVKDVAKEADPEVSDEPYGPKRRGKRNNRKTKEASQPATEKLKPGIYTTYTIQRGDNLGAIADKFGVAIGKIRKANGIKGSRITAGETLKIPKK